MPHERGTDKGSKAHGSDEQLFPEEQVLAAHRGIRAQHERGGQDPARVQAKETLKDPLKHPGITCCQGIEGCEVTLEQDVAWRTNAGQAETAPVDDDPGHGQGD